MAQRDTDTTSTSRDTKNQAPPASTPDDAVDARDREMGRDGEPLGDLGEKGKTWAPPAGKQGFSNRADDEQE